MTAFGPFGKFKDNPSEVVARMVFGDRVAVLPVSFSAVDEFLDQLPGDATHLLMLGVSVNARNLQIERTARDKIGSLPDIDGCVRERAGAWEIQGALFENAGPTDCWIESFDAGDYLCNYIYYGATRKLSHIKAGFVHLPPFTVLSAALQAVRLRRLVGQIHE
ncbi:MAG: hypothetical protein M3R13_03285 [Armatimonadota bacterium]|nr:hypothetical protein [Armatimonadota bacterium]